MRIYYKNMWKLRSSKSWGWFFIILAYEFTKGGAYNKYPNLREFHITILNFDFYIEWGDRTPYYGIQYKEIT